MTVMLWILLVAVMLLIVLNWTVGRLPPKPPAEGRFLAAQGRQLHYTDNDAPGQAVVLLHGMSSTHGDFDRVVPLLTGMRVIAVDRPGHGWSEGGSLPYDQQIVAVHELIEQLDLAPALVVGHSFGATVALGLAHEHQADVARLVLLTPAAGGARNGRRGRGQAHLILVLHLPVIKQLVHLLFAGILRKTVALRALQRTFGEVDRRYRDRVLSVTLSDENLDATARDRLAFNAAGEWLDPRTGAIETPATVLAAVDDEIIPLRTCRRLVKMLPHAALVEVEGGHTMPQDRPHEVARAVQQAANELE